MSRIPRRKFSTVSVKSGEGVDGLRAETTSNAGKLKKWVGVRKREEFGSWMVDRLGKMKEVILLGQYNIALPAKS